MPSGRLVAIEPPLNTRCREAVEATDWDEHAVVDVVHFEPATGRGFEDSLPRTEVHRYREHAPPPGTYVNGERGYWVERATKPVYERLID